MPSPATDYSKTKISLQRVWVLLLSAVLLGGCSTVYYKTMEKFGYEKRDILVDRVEDARDSQNDAQETFRSSLERFQSVVDTPDTELKEQYAEISDAYEDSLASAEEVRDRIDKVQQLKETRVQYGQLISRMHDAEDRMEPVLQAFEDQVLYLKHNLNAQAIGSLENELVSIRQDVDSLIRNMEQSIAESEAFIQRFRQGG